MIRRRAAIFFSTCMVLFVIAPTLTSAAIGLKQIVPDTCNGTSGCTSLCDIATMAQNILTDGIYIAVFLSAVLFAWAGFLYLTNAANPGEVSRAKTIFFDVAVGLVIILASWLIVNTLMSTLANIAQWNNLC